MPTMPIVPIISNENINGNIGQCITNTSIIRCAERTSLWTCKDVGYATNSCTGKVDIYSSWSLTFSLWFGVILVAIFLLSALAIATRDHY